MDFYHLAAAPLEKVLPRMAERVLESGGRLLVVSGDEQQRALLDARLWSYRPDSFLPHGRSGQGYEAAQPVLLAATCEPLNDARNVALVDGKWRDEALHFDRAFHLFDSGMITEARAVWKDLAGREDVERRFWKQDDEGRWRQQA